MFPLPARVVGLPATGSSALVVGVQPGFRWLLRGLLATLVALALMLAAAAAQATSRSHLDPVIQQAIEVLAVPHLASLRERYRQLESRMAAECVAIRQLRERRLLAVRGDASALVRHMPALKLREITATTRGDYDLLIQANEARLVRYGRGLADLRGQFSLALAALGIRLPEAHLAYWLSATPGNDAYARAAVLQNLHSMTERLRVLALENGGKGEPARRYHGMMLILQRVAEERYAR